MPYPTGTEDMWRAVTSGFEHIARGESERRQYGLQKETLDIQRGTAESTSAYYMGQLKLARDEAQWKKDQAESDMAKELAAMELKYWQGKLENLQLLNRLAKQESEDSETRGYYDRAAEILGVTGGIVKVAMTSPWEMVEAELGANALYNIPDGAKRAWENRDFEQFGNWVMGKIRDRTLSTIDSTKVGAFEDFLKDNKFTDFYADENLNWGEPETLTGLTGEGETPPAKPYGGFTLPDTSGQVYQGAVNIPEQQGINPTPQAIASQFKKEIGQEGQRYRNLFQGTKNLFTGDKTAQAGQGTQVKIGNKVYTVSVDGTVTDQSGARVTGRQAAYVLQEYKKQVNSASGALQ